MKRGRDETTRSAMQPAPARPQQQSTANRPKYQLKIEKDDIDLPLVNKFCATATDTASGTKVGTMDFYTLKRQRGVVGNMDDESGELLDVAHTLFQGDLKHLLPRHRIGVWADTSLSTGTLVYIDECKLEKRYRKRNVLRQLLPQWLAHCRSRGYACCLTLPDSHDSSSGTDSMDSPQATSGMTKKQVFDLLQGGLNKRVEGQVRWNANVGKLREHLVQLGFRRIGKTGYMGMVPDPQHPCHAVTMGNVNEWFIDLSAIHEHLLVPGVKNALTSLRDGYVSHQRTEIDRITSRAEGAEKYTHDFWKGVMRDDVHRMFDALIEGRTEEFNAARYACKGDGLDLVAEPFTHPAVSHAVISEALPLTVRNAVKKIGDFLQAELGQPSAEEVAAHTQHNVFGQALENAKFGSGMDQEALLNMLLAGDVEDEEEFDDDDDDEFY